MTRTSWDFFVAHAGPDKETAERLYDLLADHSRVFLDSRCLRLGDDWDFELAKAQHNSFISVILVSTHTSAAYYLREEVAAAIALARQQPESHRVVPIYIDRESNAPEVPYGLRLKHGIALGEGSSLADVADKLLALHRSLRGSGAPQESRPSQPPVPRAPAEARALRPPAFDLSGFEELRAYAYSASGLNLTSRDAIAWAEAKLAEGPAFDLARFKQLRDYAYSLSGLNMTRHAAAVWAEQRVPPGAFDLEEFRKLRDYAYSVSGLNLSAKDATEWAERQPRGKER